MSASVPGSPPGIPLEQARLVTPGHEAEHAWRRQVLERLDRVTALLEELVLVMREPGGRPAPPPAARRPAARQ